MIKRVFAEYLIIGACNHGLLDFLKFLVQNKDNISYYSYYKYDDKLSKLQDEGIKYATIHGNFNIVKYLIEDCKVSVDLNDSYALRWSCYYGHLDIVKFLVIISFLDN